MRVTLDAAQRSVLESEVAAFCDAGDFESAASRAIEGYGPEVLAYIISVLGDEEDGSDAFSDFCERIWRGLPMFERRASLRTWAYQLARTAIAELQRREYRHRRRTTPLEECPQVEKVAERVRTGTVSYLRARVRNRIAELRADLPADDQTLLILRVDREMDWLDIARVFQSEVPEDEAALKRESARLRKRFQLVKERLRELAAAEGLVKG